jgi:N-acetylglucosamine-6-phosphate deacetylase
LPWCCITIGDELGSHTLEEERAHDAKEGLSKALLPSTIGQVGHEVTVQIYEARSLAALDAAGIMGNATSDPYITLEFAGAEPVSVREPSLLVDCPRNRL